MTDLIKSVSFDAWTTAAAGILERKVHARVFSDRVPLTSVRRAMTNLSDADRCPESGPPLRKTEQRVDGPFGRPEHLWEINR